LNGEHSSLKKPRIAVVGGSGYIGSAIASRLSETYSVTVLDKNPLPKGLLNKVDYAEIDILRIDEIEKAFRGMDLVIHTAIVQIPIINEQKRLGFNVNFLGTQNICKAVDESSTVKGMILSGTWHVFGERDLDGIVDESFGFRPDKVEARARLYALSKVSQEINMRYYDEMSAKIYGVIRMGTVLGEGMPEKTAANIFISKGLHGEPLTPYKHSMYRPMLYIDIKDVCEAFAKYVEKILNGQIHKEEDALAHIVNLCLKEPLTIIDLAQIVKEEITELTHGKISPKIDIVDTGQAVLFDASDKLKLRVDNTKISSFLGIKKLTHPRESLRRIITEHMKSQLSP
jgi:nucleoside-diphosphate-sugar epimerase